MMSLSKLKDSLRDYMVPTSVAVLAWPKKVYYSLKMCPVPCALKTYIGGLSKSFVWRDFDLYGQTARIYCPKTKLSQRFACYYLRQLTKENEHGFPVFQWLTEAKRCLLLQFSRYFVYRARSGRKKWLEF